MVLIGGLLPPDHWTLCLCVSGAPENKTGSDRYEREGRLGKGRRRSTVEKRSTRRGPGGDDSREEGFIVEQARKGGGREREPLYEEVGVVITVCLSTQQEVGEEGITVRCASSVTEMPKKRKSEYSGLDEVEKTLHTSFCTAANSISHLYTQAQQQQKQSFHAGERHAVEKLYFWLLREHQAGSNISVGQILGYLQNELEGVSGDDTAMSPGPQSAQQQHQAVAVAAGSVGTSGPGQIETPAAPLDQSKNSVFTGTLTSPIRRDLPAFSMTPSGYGLTNNSGHPGRRTGVGLEQHANLGWEEDQGVALYHDASATGGLGFHPTQQQQQGGDGHSFGVNDASMDMHGGGVGDSYFHQH